MSDGFTILSRLISGSGMRHKTIVSNIANVDTPGYKAKDVTFGNVLGSEMSMKVTNARHLGGEGSLLTSEVTGEQAQAWADRNTVELDIEVARMTENAMLYQAGVSMLSTKIRMFKAALRR
ncbi:MAG: flagellar basal body rod protein FlgB [Nitrospirota bacterium]